MGSWPHSDFPQNSFVCVFGQIDSRPYKKKTDPAVFSELGLFRAAPPKSLPWTYPGPTLERGGTYPWSRHCPIKAPNPGLPREKHLPWTYPGAAALRRPHARPRPHLHLSSPLPIPAHYCYHLHIPVSKRRCPGVKPRKTEKLQNHISYVYCTYVYIYMLYVIYLPYSYYKTTLSLPYTYPIPTLHLLTLEPSPKTPRATPKVRGPGPAAGPRTGGGKRNSTREK